MVGEGCLVLDMFDMIKHDPTCMEVTIRLHLLDQVESTPISINKHFEEKDLSKLLFWKTTILNIVINTIGLEK